MPLSSADNRCRCRSKTVPRRIANTSVPLSHRPLAQLDFGSQRHVGRGSSKLARNRHISLRSLGVIPILLSVPMHRKRIANVRVNRSINAHRVRLINNVPFSDASHGTLYPDLVLRRGALVVKGVVPLVPGRVRKHFSMADHRPWRPFWYLSLLQAELGLSFRSRGRTLGCIRGAFGFVSGLP